MLEYSNVLSVKEYCELRSAVEWQPIIEEQAQSGLNNSDFIIACRDNNKVVGCARIFWDKGYIDHQLKADWRIKIVIVSAKGKEPFYEKFGFQIRPNEREGAGMQMWRV
ncbi:MAG: hypothetical protein KIH00_07680 [Lachnospiraceae bacterium]|nr:hypothetical protein [Lachnospiraceae bacterium]